MSMEEVYSEIPVLLVVEEEIGEVEKLYANGAIEVPAALHCLGAVLLLSNGRL